MCTLQHGNSSLLTKLRKVKFKLPNSHVEYFEITFSQYIILFCRASGKNHAGMYLTCAQSTTSHRLRSCAQTSYL
jgi:hypothetical protein